MTRGRRAAAWAVPLLIALLTFVAFLPVLRAGFVSWDDERNFLTNPHYRGLGLTQLRWMWTTFLLGHYVPLSWMTLGLDHSLWGMNAAGYHFTNLLLQTANAVAVYFVALRIFRLAGLVGTKTPPFGAAACAAFAALLFSVHPLRVESVAWITERRDVLSGLFYSLTVLFYLRAACPERSEGSAPCSAVAKGTSTRWYWLAVVAFVCALLSKGTAVTVPAVLLILNVYPLSRLGARSGWWGESARRVYLELIPFAVLAAATVILSIVALRPPEQLTAAGKVAVSAYSLCFYLLKTILPLNLSPLYEMPQTVDPLAPVFLLSYGGVVALSILAWSFRRRWPGVTAACLAFVAISLPMLGVVQNGPQIAADRYTYHAAPALAILVAAAVWLIAKRSVAMRGAFAVGALAVLAALTWRQTAVWHDSDRLWSRVLLVSDESALGHSAMASLLFKQNEVDEAMAHSLRAVAIAPDYAEAHNDVGVGFARQGRLAEAVAQYQRALSLKPRYDEAENNWGVVAMQQGRLDAAVEHYRQALEMNPDNPDAHVNWGNALVRVGKTGDAIAHYQKALWIRPDHADAEHNWGVALARDGKLAEAIDHFRLALAIDSAHVEARQYLERATQLLREQRPGGRPQ